MEAAYSPLAQAQARILEQLVKSRNDSLARLGKLYLQHPDHEIYDSLPRVGALIGPVLLAKLGDDRNRYPTLAVLQAVAGTCPVTNRSGKYSHVYFRKACDHEFRHIIQQWARLTLDASPWAAAYYQSVRPHCKSDSDAIRRLANRWLVLQRKVALICSKSGIKAIKIQKNGNPKRKSDVITASWTYFGGSHIQFRTFVLDIAL